MGRRRKAVKFLGIGEMLDAEDARRKKKGLPPLGSPTVAYTPITYRGIPVNVVENLPPGVDAIIIGSEPAFAPVSPFKVPGWGSCVLCCFRRPLRELSPGVGPELSVCSDVDVCVRNGARP